MPSSSVIQVRAYAPDDLEALIALFRGSVRAVAGRDYTQEQITAWAPDEIDRSAWAARRTAKPTWVAAVDGAPVGFIDLEPDGRIDMLYVSADHQRRGVASALYRRVEAVARERRLEGLRTEASITARPFFERQGFQVVARQTVARRGQTLVNYRMEKRLG